MSDERVLVTIDGFDGSGKSTLARHLAAALGRRAAILAVDEFRLPVAWSSGPEAELYYDARYDLAALGACVEAFKRGEPQVRWRRFDGHKEAITGEETRSFRGADHLIVEGVFIARVPAATPAISLWIDVDEREARRRILARDLKKKRTQAEVEHRIAARYLPAYARYTAEHAPRDAATLVIDNTNARAPRVLRGSIPLAGPLAKALATLL